MYRCAPASRLRVRVLVLAPSLENRAQLLGAVSSAGIVPSFTDSFEEGRCTIERGNVDVVICEDRISAQTIAETLRRAREGARPIPVIVTSRTGEWAEFLAVLQQGAFDYLPLPPRVEEVRRILERALAEVSCTIDKSTSQPLEMQT